MSSSEHQTYKVFSQAFSKALRIKGLSNREFAKMMGKDESQISNWANGVYKPYPRTRDHICEVLGIPIIKNDDGNFEIIYDDDTLAVSSNRVESFIAEYKSRAEQKLPEGNERDLLFSILIDHTELLLEGLRLLKKKD